MITSHFALEPLILAKIQALNLPGLTNIFDETQIAGVTNITTLLPACILFTGPGQYNPGTEGGLQTETQQWQLSIVVKHTSASATQTTASVAGQYLTPILQTLIGQSLSADFKPLEILSRPQANYETGWAEFPVILQTSFDLQGA